MASSSAARARRKAASALAEFQPTWRCTIEESSESHSNSARTTKYSSSESCATVIMRRVAHAVTATLGQQMRASTEGTKRSNRGPSEHMAERANEATTCLSAVDSVRRHSGLNQKAKFIESSHAVCALPLLQVQPQGIGQRRPTSNNAGLCLVQRVSRHAAKHQLNRIRNQPLRHASQGHKSVLTRHCGARNGAGRQLLGD